MSNQSNLVMFPGGKRQSEADKLLIRFVNDCLIIDEYTRKRSFRKTRPAIFAYVQKLQDEGVSA